MIECVLVDEHNGATIAAFETAALPASGDVVEVWDFQEMPCWRVQPHARRWRVERSLDRRDTLMCVFVKCKRETYPEVS